MIRLVVTLFLITYSVTVFSQTEDKVYVDVLFEGNKRTKQSYLNKFFPAAGEEINEAELQQGIQWLRNLLLFSDVRLESVDSLGQKYAKITVKEKWTLLPVFNVDLSSAQNKYSLGFADYNFLGNASILKGVLYQYDFTSFEFFFSNPHFIKNKWGLQFELSNYNTLEPVYFDTEESLYRFEKLVSGLIFNREWNNKHRLYWGAVYLREKYKKQNEEFRGPDLLEFDKILTKIFYEKNAIDYFYHSMSGHRNFLAFETTSTLSGGDNFNQDFFWKVVEDFRYYKKLSPNTYAASRALVGLSKNNATPFPAFVLDNYINVRGVGNRVMRGSLELTGNFELRQTLLNRPQFVLELVNFADISTVRFAGKKFTLDNLEENLQLYAGGGLRFHLNFLFQAILRLDVGFDLYRENRKPQFLLGIGHFI